MWKELDNIYNVFLGVCIWATLAAVVATVLILVAVVAIPLTLVYAVIGGET